MADSLINLDPAVIAGILIIVLIALVAGFYVRKSVMFGWPKDIISIAIFVLMVIIAGVSSAIIPVFFIGAYLIGFWMGSYVVHKEYLEFVQIYIDDTKRIHFRILEGYYFDHPKHGLCCAPTTNGELIDQVFRKIFHKVEMNAPPDVIAYIDDADANAERKIPKWTKKPEANLVDDQTGRKLILIEDIKTTERNDGTAGKTIITLAYGSMIPRAHLLKEIATLDQLNKSIESASAEAVKVKTKVMSKLPEISAKQLMAIVDNNPSMEIVNQFLDHEEEEQRKAAEKRAENRQNKKILNRSRKKEDDKDGGD